MDSGQHTSSAPSTTILVVDDAESVRRILELRLSKAGYRVLLAADGDEALERLAASRPDLVVLDVMLPKRDGFQVCQAIRDHSDVPIIFLSGRSGVLERVMGLELGADDYLVKPFSPRELEIRIAAVLKRARIGLANRQERHLIEVGDIRVDTFNQQVFRGDQRVRLTDLEFHLLSVLLRHPGQPWSRVELLRQIWGYVPPHHARVRSVDVHVARLRSKLELDPENPEFILTERGTGYLFRRLVGSPSTSWA